MHSRMAANRFLNNASSANWETSRRARRAILHYDDRTWSPMTGRPAPRNEPRLQSHGQLRTMLSPGLVPIAPRWAATRPAAPHAQVWPVMWHRPKPTGYIERTVYRLNSAPNRRSRLFPVRPQPLSSDCVTVRRCYSAEELPLHLRPGSGFPRGLSLAPT